MTKQHWHWNEANYPHFVCHEALWAIHCDDLGYCAAIPTPEGVQARWTAKPFGDLLTVKRLLGSARVDRFADKVATMEAGIEVRRAFNPRAGILDFDACRVRAQELGYKLGETNLSLSRHLDLRKAPTAGSPGHSIWFVGPRRVSVMMPGLAQYGDWMVADLVPDPSRGGMYVRHRSYATLSGALDAEGGQAAAAPTLSA